MANFCKVFQVAPDEQVLAIMGYDADEKNYFFSLETDFDGMRLKMTFSYGEEAKAIEYFERFTLLKALDWRHRMEIQTKED